MHFVTDKKKLSKPCKPCQSLPDGLNVGNKLLEILARYGDGVGLAANQVGIDTSVCVIKVNKPLILVNPRIVGKFGKSFFQEGCLSFEGAYECVCVQHEVDHLNGITMFDRAVDKEILNG